VPASQAETLADPATIIASKHVPDGTLPMFGTSGYAMSGWQKCCNQVEMSLFVQS
jgi:hypothetical protein